MKYSGKSGALRCWLIIANEEPGEIGFAYDIKIIIFLRLVPRFSGLDLVTILCR